MQQRHTARDRQREETRQRVFSSAVEIFRRDGVEPTRFEDIAQMAGVSRGTVYFHFPTKDDVLAELLTEAHGDLIRGIDLLPLDASLSTVMSTVAKAIGDRWQSEPLLFLGVGLVALKRLGSGNLDEPARKTLSNRFQLAIERNELTDNLGAEILADVYLLTIFAAALAWCGRPGAPLEQVLIAASHLFLNGAKG